MSSSESDNGEDMEWLIHEYRKRKRKKNSLTQEDIQEIIGANTSSSNKNLSLTKEAVKTNDGKNIQNTPKKIQTFDTNLDKASHTPPQQNTSNNRTISTIPNTNQTSSHPQTNYLQKHHNYSAKMREITHKQYKYLFYLKPTENKTRIEMSDIWESKFTNSQDVIIKTQQGFLLKTDYNKANIISTLKTMVADKTLINFTETVASSQPARNTPSASYCCVIAAVEPEIQDNIISDYLKSINIDHRYCKRIISRQTNRPTLLIRIISGCLTSYEKLLNNGLFYKNRHYAVYTASPPQPVPLSCNRCQQYTHKTEDCTTPIKCTKCRGNHHDMKCPTQLPSKCVACQSEDHAAWSSKCPKRPSKPIDGIPNIPIKSINKKTNEINQNITRNNRIHSPITVHDFIINTYVDKINNPKHTNRESLLDKLKRKFIRNYNIDTTPVFSYNRLYILMFDLNNPESISPTEPTTGNTQVQIQP